MREDICGTIRDGIIHLQFKPGQPLNENKLAQEFHVSRTPIREALHRLSLEGLVIITPNLGARVAEINLRDFRELIELRIILERGAAALVARNVTEKDITAMQQLNARILAEKTEDLDTLTDFDSEFHHIIQRATHNKLLANQMAAILVKFTWVMRWISHKPELVLVKIPEFIEAMQNRDAVRLKHLLVEHVEYFVQKMRAETMQNFSNLWNSPI